MSKKSGNKFGKLIKPPHLQSVRFNVLIVSPNAYFHVPESFSCSDVVLIAYLNDFKSRGVTNLVIDNTLC